MAADILRLKNMTFHAFHGVWDEEREIGQRFEVDVELQVDAEAAAETDKLKDTVDLAVVFEVVEGVVVHDRYKLLETMGEKIAQRILKDFGVDEVRVRVRKPHAPIRGTQDGMEVELVRSQANRGQ
jgi:dihydroneopterin aldolase